MKTFTEPTQSMIEHAVKLDVDLADSSAEIVLCHTEIEELRANNAALLEACQLCECELSMYSMLASQSNNPQAWQDAIDAARKAIRESKRAPKGHKGHK